MKKVLVIISVFCLCLIIVFGMVAFFVNPMNRYNLKDCSVSVLNYDHSDTLCKLTDEQRDEFVKILSGVDFNNTASYDEKLLVGMNYGYEIKLTNGKTIKVSVFGEYLTFGNKTYLCESALSSDLAEFAKDAFRLYYPLT